MKERKDWMCFSKLEIPLLSLVDKKTNFLSKLGMHLLFIVSQYFKLWVIALIAMGYLPNSAFVAMSQEYLHIPKTNLQNLECIFSGMHFFKLSSRENSLVESKLSNLRIYGDYTSYPYNKIGITHESNYLNIKFG